MDKHKLMNAYKNQQVPQNAVQSMPQNIQQKKSVPNPQQAEQHYSQQFAPLINNGPIQQQFMEMPKQPSLSQIRPFPPPQPASPAHSYASSHGTPKSVPSMQTMQTMQTMQMNRVSSINNTGNMNIANLVRTPVRTPVHTQSTTPTAHTPVRTPINTASHSPSHTLSHASLRMANLSAHNVSNNVSRAASVVSAASASSTPARTTPTHTSSHVQGISSGYVTPTRHTTPSSFTQTQQLHQKQQKPVTPTQNPMLMKPPSSSVTQPKSPQTVQTTRDVQQAPKTTHQPRPTTAASTSSATPISTSRRTAVVENEETGIIPLEEITLEDFKNYVKKWIEIDSYIKKASDVIKDKKKIRNKLAEVITKFMCKYNIEDLNTREGRIRCKTTYVKPPVTQKQIKEKIQDLIPERKDIVKQIYEERPRTERMSLRRLKIT